MGEEENELGFVLFEFNNVPGGSYAIQVFQDENSNEELDFGLFGPSEPWGSYLNARQAFRGPEFNEMAFTVSENIYGIEIKVREYIK